MKRLASMVYKFFDKKAAVNGTVTLANKSAANNEIKQNLELAKELHKPIIRNFKKKKSLNSRFKYNIRSVDWADVQLISKFNKEFRF